MSAAKIALGLGGAFLLYEWYTGGLSSLLGGASTVPAPATTAPIGTGTATVPVTATPASPAPYVVSNPFVKPTAAQLVAQAGGVNQLNYFQWNYYYAQLTGHPTLWTTVTQDGVTLMTADQYLAMLNNAGVSGLGGLGMIIDLQSMFAGMTPGSGFGVEEFNGLGIIEDNPNNSAAYIDEGPFVEASGVNGSNDGSVSDFLLAASGQGA